MATGVRKRGSTWSYYFDTAKINGERNKIEKGGFRTQKEALDARAAAIAEYNNSGRTFSPKEISVSDYLDYWLETVIHKNVDHGYSYNTYRDYESKIRLHLKPAFGIYRLSSFQYAPDKVQEWADSMKVKGFSKSMIQNTLTCLQGAMNYAILPLKYIQANPCVAVKIGKMPMDMTAKAHTEYICSAEEFNQILKRFPADNCFHLSLVVPYNTGTRIGETFAIDLSQDVDFEKHELRIHGQMQKVEKTWYIKPPKYDSYRTIKMGETLEKELKFAILQGADWYRSIGTAGSPGTKTFSLTGAIENTGLIEVPMGSTLREIIYDIGGGLKEGSQFKAVQIGGPSGGCLTEKHLDEPLDFDSVKKFDAIVGSGGMVVMDQHTCMVEVARFFMSFTQRESCGKCVPCREGTKRMLEILEKIVEGRGEEEDLDRLEELAAMIRSMALCGLGKSAPLPVISTLKLFRNEYLEHINEHKCAAKVCQAMRKYVINPEFCKGCSKCAKNCPVGAISGKVKHPFHIDPNICIKCGACKENCAFNAIYIEE